MRLLFSFLFFCFIGILGIVGTILLIINGDERFLLTESEFFFIKYSLVIGFMDICFSALLIPILAFKGIITINYYNANKRARAKTTFVIGSLSIPGFIFISIAIYNLASNPSIIYVMDGLIFLIYLSSIITLMSHESQKKRN